MDDKLITVYEPLNENKNEIRVARLRAIGHNRRQQLNEETIVCHLERRNFDDDVVYSALSYAWADATGQQEILLGCQTCLVSASISRNLAQALRHLRHESEDIILWIDQLCINQNDPREKRNQIQKMKSIYERAAQVISWLGVLSENSDLVFIMLRRIAKEHAMLPSSAILSEIVQESGVYQSEQDLLDSLGEALPAFTNRSYWTRLWILQEFVVATKLVIQCGTQQISDSSLSKAWERLGDAIQLANARAQIPESRKREVFAIANAWRHTRWDSWLQIRRVLARRDDYLRKRRPHDLQDDRYHSMFMIMYTTLTTFFGQHQLLCSDPRDRVFALLGLASDPSLFNQFPDYTKSTETIYEEASRIFLLQGFVDVLSFCQEPPNCKARNMPSWAVDWSLKIRMPLWGKLETKASKGWNVEAKVVVPNDKTINICGVVVDTIHSVGTSWDSANPLNSRQVHTFLREVRSFCNKSRRVPSDEEEFTCAQIAAPVARCYLENQAQMVKEYQAACHHFERISNLPDLRKVEGASDEYVSAYARELSLQLLNCPFISNDDYVGVAPPYIRTGDYICIFPGGNTPYILRPQLSGDFIVVGAAYVWNHAWRVFQTKAGYSLVFAGMRPASMRPTGIEVGSLGRMSQNSWILQPWKPLETS